MSKPFDVFAGEWRHFIRTPMLIATFVAIAFVPILYSGFLIKGTWDPYGQLKNLPIAVVNLDQGAVMDGKPRNVGEDFVGELKQKDGFDWRFVTAKEAEQGMKSNRYYGAITIPASFSADAASVTEAHPKQAEINFEANSFNNFIAGQIGENAVKELRNQLSTTLTEAYSKSVLAQFASVATGFGDAAAGAGSIHDGAVQLDTGIGRLQSGMSPLLDGAQSLQVGSAKMRDGAKQLEQGASTVAAGGASLSSGTKQLQSAGAKLAAGAENAAKGGGSLAASLQTAATGADKLAAGLASASSGSQSLSAGLADSSQASTALANGAADLAAGMSKLAAAKPEIAADETFQQLLAASKAIAAGSKQAEEGQAKLSAAGKKLAAANEPLLTGARTLSQGGQALASGAKKLQEGLTGLREGMQAMNGKIPALASGASRLARGAAELERGAGGLAGAGGQMTTGAGTLVDGVKRLQAGTAELADGSSKLVEGSSSLATQLKAAADKTGSVKADDAAIRMLADPVKITANDDRKVRIYGSGIAPYFISMSLYAGALVFTTIYGARTSRVPGASGGRLLVGKLLVFVLMSIAQSLIVCTALVTLLGLNVQSVPLFYAFVAITGLTYMLLIQMLVTWLDQPGRFVVLVLMIFQLASSAGTFPLELLPGWAKAMHPWLPMSYSIQGLRDVVSSGDYARMWHQAAVLAIYAVASLILICVYFLTRKTETDPEQLMPIKV